MSGKESDLKSEDVACPTQVSEEPGQTVVSDEGFRRPVRRASGETWENSGGTRERDHKVKRVGGRLSKSLRSTTWTGRVPWEDGEGSEYVQHTGPGTQTKE